MQDCVDQHQVEEFQAEFDQWQCITSFALLIDAHFVLKKTNKLVYC
jgi:hypothetical protein